MTMITLLRSGVRENSHASFCISGSEGDFLSTVTEIEI
jgi:hypothetical protein